jgi:hypothetical protein
MGGFVRQIGSPLIFRQSIATDIQQLEGIVAVG